LDVSDIENPVELGTFRFEARSHNVFIQDAYAYLSNELGGVVILDVSDPNNIKQVGTIRTKADAFWVVADYPFVYVAEQEEGVNVYNISDPSNPTFVSNYKTPQWAWALFLVNNILYVADKTAGMVILDVSDPSNMQRIGLFSQMKYTKNIFVENEIAYIANGPDGLSIVDVSNPKFPKLISSIRIDGFVNDAQRSGNSVYIANELKRRLEIIDVTDLSNPIKVAEYVTEGKVYSASKFDVYVFVASDNKTVILRHNSPPVIAKIEDQVVDEVQTLNIAAQAYDPDDDPLYYIIENIPKGAKFDSATGTFTWAPTYEQSGSYPNVKIIVAEQTASQLNAATTFTITVNHVNRHPILSDVPDSTVMENQSITFTIPEGSDPDLEDKGRLVYYAENMPEGATFDPDTRTFSWQPTFEQSGVFMVDFVVKDSENAVMRDGSSITVVHVDRKPKIEKPLTAQRIKENQELVFQIVASDPDREDQDKLSYMAFNLPEGADFNANTATFNWIPTFDQSGDYQNPMFVFKAGNLSDSITIPISVEHVNRSPMLDAISNKNIDENKILKFYIAGTDPDVEDSGKLVYTATNLPQGAVFDADSLKFMWTPGFDQSGTFEQTQFTVTDPGGLTDSKAISIEVNHVNRSPQLAEIMPKTIDENKQITIELQGSDPDKEDEGLLVYSATGLPEGSSLESSVFTWTPTYNQSGTYNVSFTVSDTKLEDTKETSITVSHVNRAPTIMEIASQTVAENQNLSFSVEGSDPDTEDTDLWKLSVLSMPDGAQFDPETGVFNWSPNFDQSGTYKVSFLNTDPQGLTYQQDVEISVSHVNRTPVLPEQPAQSVDENATLSIKLVPATDPDVEDEGKLVYSVSNLPEGAVFDPVTLDVSWTPSYEQSGSYTSEVSVKDGEFTVTQPLTIEVNHINRPPVLETVDLQNLKENESWTLTINFSDPDVEDEGKILLSAENLPEGCIFDQQEASLAWTPTYEQSGSYSGIKIAATDEGGLKDDILFDIQVDHINRPPQLSTIESQSGTENSLVSLKLVASDPDKEDDGKLVYSASNLPEGATLDANTGNLSWTPGFLQAGEYSVSFKVTDTGNLSNEQTVLVTITDLNRIPVINEIAAQNVDENSNLSFKISASDQDSDNELAFTANNLPEGATFDPANQTFSWVPGFEQEGNYTVGFMVSDAKENVTTEVSITVNNVNRAPVIEDPGAQRVNENESLSFVVNATDEDRGTELSYEASGLPEGASFNGQTRMFTWKPTFEQAGEYQLKLNVSDGQDTAEKTVNITVDNVNRTPSISGSGAEDVRAGETIDISFSGNDPDNDALTFSSPNLPNGASLDSNSGRFSWSPTAEQIGTVTVTILISDGKEEAQMTITINVQQPASE
jgi:hypothetical protein